ncbi:hypothetical protein ElyMa_006636700, partial [Elysia marginata]
SRNKRVCPRISRRIYVGPQEPLLATVKRRKLAWFGHVTRHDSLSKTNLQGTVEGKRRRGRQRKAWCDNIKEWTGLAMFELFRSASEMHGDRKLILLPSDPPDDITGRGTDTWALTHTEEEKLNAFHRKQLKKILNIKFPVKITNKSLYKKCQEKPLSLQLLESRWKLFGHNLRRHRDIPANKATRAYFTQCGKNHRGRPRTTLPTVLNRNLALIDHEIRLHSSGELDKITAFAQDRRQWHEMTAKIERAAEASQTENWDAPRH